MAETACFVLIHREMLIEEHQLPQGMDLSLTIKGGLQALGFDSVSDVRAGKYLVVTLDADDEGDARSRVEEMTRQLLANAVIEDYRIELKVPSPATAAGQGEGS